MIEDFEKLARPNWDRLAARRKVVTRVLRGARSLKTRKPSAAAQVGTLKFSSYRGRYVGEWTAVRRRRVAITIETPTTIVGLAELREWAVSDDATRVDFCIAADDDGDHEGDMAEFIGAFWRSDDWPGLYGNIVHFERLAIDTSRAHGVSTLADLGGFLQTEFGQRASIMLLKAFPLEFERIGFEVDPDSKLLGRRRMAMMRLYRSALGATPFAKGHPALDGWMWRSFSAPPPLPAPDPNWHKELEESCGWLSRDNTQGT